MDRPVVDARAEAVARTDGRFDVRVLEPSPPPVDGPPWFADDPVHEVSVPGRPVVAPVPLGGGALTWDDLIAADPDLEGWCADRWLGAPRALTAPGDGDALVRTRHAWHVLAEHVVAPARHRVNTKIGLRYTRGGFGTPFLADGTQVRLDGSGLVVVHGGDVTVHPVTSAAAAGRALDLTPGAPTDVYTPDTELEPDAPLVTDEVSARFLGDWFGFGMSVLEGLRADVPEADAPARVQLWPEHFDLSFDFGDESAGRRGTYGASPGDDAHPLPYLYVTPWAATTGDFWNEGSFASLGFDALLAADDQRHAACAFFDRATVELAR